MSQRRLELIVGKGGVGKSTVAAALALAAARRGSRVLAMELGRPGGLSSIFGSVPPDAGVPVEVRPGLWISYVEGEAALAEYLELVVPIRRLLAAVFTSRIYRFFVAAAPGLKELMTVGKIWYEQDRKDANGRNVWDHVVVDVGASGHSLQYLQMPSTAAQTFAGGLVHREATRVESLLKDPKLTAVHIVAIPEEMPVTEALEISTKLRDDLGLPVGRMFLNRCREALPSGAQSLAARLQGAMPPPDQAFNAVPAPALVEGLRIALERALAWDPIQRRSMERLAAESRTDVVTLPLLVAEEFGIHEVERIATLVARKGDRE